MSTERDKFDHEIDPDIVTEADTPKVTMYCIKTCSTCKTARKELEAAGYTVFDRDVRAKDMGLSDFEYLEGKLGWEAMLNRKSRTWRELDEGRKTSLDRDAALELFVEKPTLMKRPVLDRGDRVTVGWTDEVRGEFGL